MMEKRGVITDETPGQGPRQSAPKPGEPTTKEAADQLEDHPVNRLIDAVADRSQPKKP